MTDGESQVGRSRARWPRWIASAGLLTVVGLLVLGLLAGAHLTGQLGRIPAAFAGLADRPPRPSAGPGVGSLNVLVALTRAAGEPVSWRSGTSRADALLVIHLDADRRAGSVVMLPLEATTQVSGRGSARVAAALHPTKPVLAVETVENLTGLRIDHLALLTWTGLAELAGTSPRLDVEVPPASSPSSVPGRRLQALFLRRLTEETLHTRMRKRPIEVYGVLDALTRTSAVDSDFSAQELGGLALSLRNLRSSNIAFLVAPISPDGAVADTRATTLWDAIAADRAAEWLVAHPASSAAGPG